MTTNLFPYQDIFINYCNQQALNKKSVSQINSTITSFWSFYKEEMSSNNPDIKKVTSYDISKYLQRIKCSKRFSASTFNRLLSYMRKYFRYLTAERYIDAYPLYSFKGKSINKTKTVIINWMRYIPTFLKYDLKPETIKVLTLISLNYTPEELLLVSWHDIADKINNKDLHNFFVHHLNFEKTESPQILNGKKHNKIKSIETIMFQVRKDKKKLDIPLTLRQLRQSYILSIVSKKTLTDTDLLNILNINQKSLAYYKWCVANYKLIPYDVKKRSR